MEICEINVNGRKMCGVGVPWENDDSLNTALRVSEVREGEDYHVLFLITISCQITRNGTQRTKGGEGSGFSSCFPVKCLNFFHLPHHCAL